MIADSRIDELWPLVWQGTWETVYIVAIVLTLGGVLGLLLGLALYVTRSGGLYASRATNLVLNLLVNFFRPIPFVIFIAAVQPLARVVVGTGIGNPAIIFALTLAATFGISRIVEQNLVTVDPGVIEAARSMGAGRGRIVRTVVLPEALGPLVLGYTFVFVAIVDMTAIAGVVGGGGLGNFALQYGFRQFDAVVTWTAVIIIVALVQVVQLAGNVAARRILRR
ncbi:ABC transporter permease [Nocardioides oleivorans]|uniref:ABC transporter permease n=1 Tax=Nocardioides oleivorans TaxID=273676 RepID=A0A4Q2RZX1_9ACTN|nr:methionine ABC transporter permease [Nocardioides oleivorans]RYB93625.1 ABC transporter permease [Nocardioides oleivorans]